MLLHFLLPVIARSSQHSTAIPQKDRVAYIQNLAAALKGESNYGDAGGPTAAEEALSNLESIGQPAVPYVLPLLDSKIGWEKLHATQFLANLKVKEAIPKVVRIMKTDPEAGLRAAVAYELGKFGDRSVTRDLFAAGSSSDKELARAAWSALGDLKEPKAIPLLIDNLDHKVRAIPSLSEVPDDVPAIALSKIGEFAIAPLIAFIQTAKGQELDQAAWALGLIGSPKAVAKLEAMLPSPDTRKAAIRGLLATPGNGSIQLAGRMLADVDFRPNALSYLYTHLTQASEPTIRTDLARAIKQKNDSSVEQDMPLFKRLGGKLDVDLLCRAAQLPGIGGETVQALADTRDPRAVPILAQLAGAWVEGGYEAKDRAAETIGLFGPPAFDALMNRLKHGARPEAVGHALSLFRDIKTSTAMRWIISTTDNDHVRAGALIALGRMKDRDSKDLLVEALADHSKEIREAAARGLALMGDPKSIPYLLKMTPNVFPAGEWTALGKRASSTISDQFLKGNWAAIEAIRRLGPSSFVAALREGVKSSDVSVAGFSVNELAAVKDRQAIPELLDSLRTSQPEVRWAAYQALQKLSD